MSSQSDSEEELQESSSEYRPRPPKALEKSVIEPLVGAGIFRTKYEVMTFAAALGYQLGKKSVLDNPGEGIRMEYFRNDSEDLTIDVIALAEFGDLRKIAPESQTERAKLFEQYAKAGLEELQEACFDSSMTASDGIMRLVHRLLTAPPEKTEEDDYVW